ncbi:MAG: putative protease YhbU precursor [Bacteroidota bacterium]|jgi:putative protease
MAVRKKNKVELLAPAGSFDAMQAAINAGANAIYFGVEQLNMRAKSTQSFTVDDIAEVVKRCHSNNVKAYLTLNTIMYEHDLQLLKGILKEVKKQKLDAVIAADFAVIEQCNAMGIPLQISTQANISNISAVQFFSKFSDVVVLARELTLQQIEQICKEIKRKKIKGISGELLQVEVFVHGALCMAVSGKCYMSLHTQNASANRGACTQNCRRPYLVTDTETGAELMIDNEYIMSPKDLCTIGMLDQIINSGVAVLKIEGRTKGADYVDVVTRCYRAAIDAVADGSFNQEKVKEWEAKMSTVYNRGFWEGYYLGRKLGEWTPQPGSAATEKKIYVGKATKFYPRIGVAEYLIEAGSIQEGDELMISGPECGMVRTQLNPLMVNGEQATQALRGDKITFPFASKLTTRDKLYKIVSADNA